MLARCKNQLRYFKLYVHSRRSYWTSKTLKIRDSAAASLAASTMADVLWAVDADAPFDTEKTSLSASTASAASCSICWSSLLISALTSLSKRASSIKLLCLHELLRCDRRQTVTLATLAYSRQMTASFCIITKIFILAYWIYRLCHLLAQK